MNCPSTISKTHIDRLRKIISDAGDTEIALNTSDENIFGLWYTVNFYDDKKSAFYKGLLSAYPYLKDFDLDLDNHTIVMLRIQIIFLPSIQKEITVHYN